MIHNKDLQLNMYERFNGAVLDIIAQKNGPSIHGPLTALIHSFMDYTSQKVTRTVIPLENENELRKYLSGMGFVNDVDGATRVFVLRTPTGFVHSLNMVKVSYDSSRKNGTTEVVVRSLLGSFEETNDEDHGGFISRDIANLGGVNMARLHDLIEGTAQIGAYPTTYPSNLVFIDDHSEFYPAISLIFRTSGFDGNSSVHFSGGVGRDGAGPFGSVRHWEQYRSYMNDGEYIFYLRTPTSDDDRYRIIVHSNEPVNKKVVLSSIFSTAHLSWELADQYIHNEEMEKKMFVLREKLTEVRHALDREVRDSTEKKAE